MVTQGGRAHLLAALAEVSTGPDAWEILGEGSLFVSEAVSLGLAQMFPSPFR